MSGKRSKRHHHNPIVLQKPFQSKPGKIWYAEKNKDGRFFVFEERNHESAFWERNYNTTIEDGRPSDRLETGFWGAVDDHLGKLVPKIDDALENSTIPLFSGEPLDSLYNLFAALMMRSPDILPDYDAAEMGREVANQTIELSTELSEKERTFLNSSDRMVQNGRHIIAMSRVAEPTRVLAALREYEVRFVRSEARSAFILGSRLVYRIGNGGNTHLDNPNTELWLPISPRSTVVLVKSRPETPHCVEFSRAKVRKFNEYVCRSSSKVGSHSYKLLRSLTRSKL